MFLEEKIDALKRSISSKDLTIRYNDFGEVMTKIESAFLTKHMNHQFSGWTDRLKPYSEILFDGFWLDFIKKELVEDQKYWWVFTDDLDPHSRHRLFDATIVGGYHVSFLFSKSPVFIVEKKYAWMLMVDREQKSVKKLLPATLSLI
ncbi:MAG: hypothetical protein HYZ44_15315 [Bacteroidetes bacterium]|nr:hypothetical protein [Bacteroidota bacterium]